MHEYMYLQTDALRKLRKEYSHKKSLKMAKTNSTGFMTSYQAATLEKGKTYTFSAYFKTLNSAAAQLRAVYKNSAGADVTVDSRRRRIPPPGTGSP